MARGTAVEVSTPRVAKPRRPRVRVARASCASCAGAGHPGRGLLRGFTPDAGPVQTDAGRAGRPVGRCGVRPVGTRNVTPGRRCPPRSPRGSLACPARRASGLRPRLPEDQAARGFRSQERPQSPLLPGFPLGPWGRPPQRTARCSARNQRRAKHTRLAPAASRDGVPGAARSTAALPSTPVESAGPTRRLGTRPVHGVILDTFPTSAFSVRPCD